MGIVCKSQKNSGWNKGLKIANHSDQLAFGW